jgi:hypothetical protein
LVAKLLNFLNSEGDKNPGEIDEVSLLIVVSSSSLHSADFAWGRIITLPKAS